MHNFEFIAYAHFYINLSLLVQIKKSSRDIMDCGRVKAHTKPYMHGFPSASVQISKARSCKTILECL